MVGRKEAVSGVVVNEMVICRGIPVQESIAISLPCRHLPLRSILVAMRACLTLICLLWTVPVYTVEPFAPVQPDPVLEPWRWTVYDHARGLAGGVRGMYEDREGSVWIATDRGAQKYDGYRWTTYTTKEGLGHDQVRVIIQDRDGAMWFGSKRPVNSPVERPLS